MVSQGKNAANPFGLASILTQDERKSACIKHGSDNSFHPMEAATLLAVIYALLGDEENKRKYYHIAITSGRNPDDLDEVIDFYLHEV